MDAREENILALASWLRPGKALDLGTYEGAHARLLAGAGWKVVATDARPFPWPYHEKITYWVIDVRDTPMDGYDLILCSGLFYHLEYPDQVKLLEKAFPAPLILDTHIYSGTPERAVITPDEGIRGCVYPEGEAAHSAPEQGCWASWGNEESFWPDLASLRKMTGRTGYSLKACEPWYAEDRTTFFCLPEKP